MNPEIYERMREIEDRHWWFTARRKIVGDLIASLGLPSRAAILDAGCGTGGNLPLLAAFGEVTGFEADDAAIAMARARNIGRVVQGRLPDGLPSPERPFDLVVMTDVLEHLDADTASLAALRGLMKDDARLLLTVPAFPFLWSAHDVQHHHRRRYVAATLRAAISSAGLRVQYLSYFNTILFPLVAAVRLAHKLAGVQDAGGDLSLPGERVNRMLESVFASERWWLRRARLPFGVSLLAIASRS